jgi:hypothetical protein
MSTPNRTAGDGTVDVLVLPVEAPFFAAMVGDEIVRVIDHYKGLVEREGLIESGSGDFDDLWRDLERLRGLMERVGWGSIDEQVAFPMESADTFFRKPTQGERVMSDDMHPYEQWRIANGLDDENFGSVRLDRRDLDALMETIETADISDDDAQRLIRDYLRRAIDRDLEQRGERPGEDDD